MKNTNDFSKVKVGDKLWSIQLGDCEVDVINEAAPYPVRVSSEDDSIWYTKSGKYYQSDVHQSLFFNNPNIVAPEAPVQLPDLKVDAKVIVWDHENYKVNRYFSHFDQDGKIYCFSDGATSFSVPRNSNGVPYLFQWSNYEIVEE